MKQHTRSLWIASVLVIISLFVAAPASASAFWDGFPFGKTTVSSSSGIKAGPVTLCPRTITAAGISVNVFLPSKKCDTTPPPTDQCPNVPGTQTSTPCADEVCEDDGGEWDGNSCEFPEEEEPTLEFSVDPTTIDEGDSATLEWDSTDADSCTASGGWSGSKALDGTQSVSPTATTTYTLVCENEEGEVTKSVTVNVVLEPEPEDPILDFDADPTTINEGQSSTLEWNSSNADTCEASDGWSGSKSMDGSQAVSPTATTTYTLECEGDGGSVSESVTVNVILAPEPEPEEPTLDFSADPTTITQGSSSLLEWEAFDADSCEASDGWSGAKTFTGSQSVTPSATTTYTLTCVGDGGTTSESVTVNVAIPNDEPAPADNLLITEVYYDVATSTGEVESANEWVEIYNNTDATLDLSNYTIEDNSLSDALPDVDLAPGQFAVITASSTTENFWDIPDNAIVIVLNSPIGNGLVDAGDVVQIVFGEGATSVDTVSWGSNTQAFTPSVPGVATNSGDSIARDPLTVDTGTADDWEARSTPTPGE